MDNGSDSHWRVGYVVDLCDGVSPSGGTDLRNVKPSLATFRLSLALVCRTSVTVKFVNIELSSRLNSMHHTPICRPACRHGTLARHAGPACRTAKENQGAYNSGKPENLREFVNSGKLRENSGNLSDAYCFWPTVLSVEPMVQCVVCLSVVCL